jgi:hypothetical protein
MAKNCQSCGMPLKQDKNGGGTEADGSKSEIYCSLCYGDGKFYMPDVTVTEFQEFCAGQLKKQGVPGVMAWLLTRGIPKLDRWKNASTSA